MGMREEQGEGGSSSEGHYWTSEQWTTTRGQEHFITISEIHRLRRQDASGCHKKVEGSRADSAESEGLKWVCPFTHASNIPRAR